ncbi:hypothetical protein BS78_01G311200 [Paspalum vaginatum]|nr:hypothetical protein BS78_01G311200 [Paspalum vaginatum]
MSRMPLVLAFHFLLAVAAARHAAAASALPHGGHAEREFVRGCCARTLYPRLCGAGLAPYAASVHSSRARLAVAAANLTLAALDALAARIPPPSPGGGGGSNASSSGGALADCADAVAAASDQTARAAERLRGVERAVGPEVRWRVDDALTWLSAAMTYEDTCADGLASRKSAPAPVRAELRVRVRRAKQYTSIALALVNIIVSKPTI